MVKGFRQIACLTALSRVFGFIRDMVYSHFFGANALLDAWVIAFRIPNLSRRLFGEGAASASLIPVYSEQLHNDPQQARQLINTVVTVLFVLLAAIVLIGEAAIWGYHELFSANSETKLILSLTSIMLPYMLLVCLVAILAGVLNVHKHFASPAAAPIILNVFVITAVLLTAKVLKIETQAQLFFVAVAVIIAGLAQIAVQIPALRTRGISIRPGWQIYSASFKKIIILMGPMVLGLTVTQINTLADDLIAWWFSGSAEKGIIIFEFLGNAVKYPLWRGSVSHLYYSQRLYQLPLGVFGISLAIAIFPVMTSYAAQKDLSGLRRTISRGLQGAVFIAIPATVGLIIIAKPLISLAFQHGQFSSEDTNKVAGVLLFYALGLCGYFTQQIVTRAFYSMQDSKTPMHSALTAVFVNIILNLTLIWPLGTIGLAVSTALCSYLQVVTLVIVLRRRLGSSTLEGLLSALVKTIIATVCMSVVAGIALWLSKAWGDVFKLLLVVPTAVVTYLLAAGLLGGEMISLLTTAQKE